MEQGTQPTRWSVSVDFDGETILTIGYDWLAGKPDLSPSDVAAIRHCAHHLLAFIGDPEPTLREESSRE